MRNKSEDIKKGYCKSCGRFIRYGAASWECQNHKKDCRDKDIDFAWLAMEYAQRKELQIREKLSFTLKELERTQGKLAVVKLENNKLRSQIKSPTSNP